MRLLKFIVLGLLVIPFTASAAIATPWSATSTDKGAISPNLINGNAPFLNINGTGTSTFVGPIRSTCFTTNGTTCISGTGGSGTVTQVNTTYPILGGPITTTGTLSLAFSTTTLINAGTGISTSSTATGAITINNTGVLSFNTRTGAVALSSSDVTTALGFTPFGATNPLPVANGGTASTTLTGILKGAGTSQVGTAVNGTDYSLITALTCSAGQFLNTVIASGIFTCGTPSGTGSGLSTSSPISAGNLLEYSSTGAGSAFGVATGTVANGTGISVTAGQSVIGSGLTITNTSPLSGLVAAFPFSFTGGNTLTWIGLSTSTALAAGQPVYATGVNTLGSVSSSTFLTSIGGQVSGNYITALTGDVTATGPGSVVATLKNTGTAGTYRSTTFDAQGRETSGTNPTTFAGYAISDTSANLAAALTDETGTGLAVFNASPTFTGVAVFANSSTSLASFTYASSTAGYFGTLNIPNLGTAAGAFLAVDATGKVIATTTPSGSGGVTSIQQTGGGSAQTGAITFATSSVTLNGITHGLNITNTGGAFTFTPTASGNLTVSGGGTGQTTFTSSQLLYGNGTNALSSVATSSGQCTSASGITCSAFTVVGSVSPTFALSAIPNSSLANSTISGIALGNSLNTLTATNGSLTFTGNYDGSVARTVGLNVGNTNTWTVLQNFAFSSTTAASFGYASSTAAFFGNLNLPRLGTAAGAFLAVDANGNVIATTSPSSSVGGTETPSGTINGSNTVFTVTNRPVAVFLNGTYQTPGGTDYTLTGTGPYTITYNLPPPTGSTHTSQYLNGGGGGGAVSSVSNADGTLTISPTIGVVVASLNLAHTNTWSALQTINYASSTVVTIANELTVPYSTSPTLLANGDIGVDSTANQFKFFSGGATRVLMPEQSRSFTYATSSWTGTTTIPLDSVINAYTFTKASCYTDVGTVNVAIGQGSATTTYLNASTTNGIVSFTSNNDMTSGNKVKVDIGTPASSPTKVVCTAAYTFDPQ